MLRPIVMLGILLLYIWPVTLPAKTVEGIEFPETLQEADALLLLNGAGVREKLFIDIYISALYLEFRSQDAEKILRDDIPMGLRLRIVTGLMDSDDFKDAINEGFAQSTGGNIQPVQTQLDQFMSLMNQEIDEGDYYDFIYLPQSGLKIYRNGTYLDEIKGLNFKRAFFGIWLGPDPVDEDLKQQMLGLE